MLSSITMYYLLVTNNDFFVGSLIIVTRYVIFSKSKVSQRCSSYLLIIKNGTNIYIYEEITNKTNIYEEIN